MSALFDEWLSTLIGCAIVLVGGYFYGGWISKEHRADEKRSPDPHDEKSKR